MEMPPDRSRLLAEIDFDDPGPVRSSFREDREEEMTVKPERTSFRGKTGESTTEKKKLKPNFREETERPNAPGTSTETASPILPSKSKPARTNDKEFFCALQSETRHSSELLKRCPGKKMSCRLTREETSGFCYPQDLHLTYFGLFPILTASSGIVLPCSERDGLQAPEQRRTDRGEKSGRNGTPVPQSRVTLSASTRK